MQGIRCHVWPYLFPQLVNHQSRHQTTSKMGLSALWLQMTTSMFLRGLCVYVWVYILTLSPPRVVNLYVINSVFYLLLFLSWVAWFIGVFTAFTPRIQCFALQGYIKTCFYFLWLPVTVCQWWQQLIEDGTMSWREFLSSSLGSVDWVGETWQKERSGLGVVDGLQFAEYWKKLLQRIWKVDLGQWLGSIIAMSKCIYTSLCYIQ